MAERQPCACVCCVSCHVVSACERVCELVLCDGVPHCATCNSPEDCDTCVLFCGMLEHLQIVFFEDACVSALHWKHPPSVARAATHSATLLPATTSLFLSRSCLGCAGSLDECLPRASPSPLFKPSVSISEQTPSYVESKSPTLTLLYRCPSTVHDDVQDLTCVESSRGTQQTSTNHSCDAGAEVTA